MAASCGIRNFLLPLLDDDAAGTCLMTNFSPVSRCCTRCTGPSEQYVRVRMCKYVCEKLCVRTCGGGGGGGGGRDDEGAIMVSEVNMEEEEEDAYKEEK